MAARGWCKNCGSSRRFADHQGILSPYCPRCEPLFSGGAGAPPEDMGAMGGVAIPGVGPQVPVEVREKVARLLSLANNSAATPAERDNARARICEILTKQPAFQREDEKPRPQPPRRPPPWAGRPQGWRGPPRGF